MTRRRSAPIDRRSRCRFRSRARRRRSSSAAPPAPPQAAPPGHPPPPSLPRNRILRSVRRRSPRPPHRRRPRCRSRNGARVTSRAQQLRQPNDQPTVGPHPRGCPPPDPARRRVRPAPPRRGSQEPLRSCNVEPPRRARHPASKHDRPQPRSHTHRARPRSHPAGNHDLPQQAPSQRRPAQQRPSHPAGSHDPLPPRCHPDPRHPIRHLRPPRACLRVPGRPWRPGDPRSGATRRPRRRDPWPERRAVRQCR